MLDTSRQIETPEGVSLELRAAGPVPRCFAWALDFFIRAVCYLVFAMFLPALGKFGVGLFLLVLFLMEWFYPVLFEVYRNGATPGKRMMGIKVLQDNGIPVGWAPSMIRNLLRAVDFLPVLYGFGLVSMLVNKDFKRLGDFAAGTLVVYDDPPQRTAALPAAAPMPPLQQLTLLQQRAIVNFAERAQGLTSERAVELADIAYPLTQARGGEAVERLYRIANWLQGRR